MSVVQLSEYIEEVGYPRMLFLNIKDNNEKEFILEIHYNDLDDAFYLINGSLVRKKGTNFKRITNTVSNHLYSSIIKNIILNDNYDEVLTYNMLLYILYYRVTYKAHSLLNNNQITDGIIIELSNIIKLMIDRKNSTYRNKPAISDAIDEMRRLIKRERINSGFKPKLNLRR